jgi:hypothetical protein
MRGGVERSAPPLNTEGPSMITKVKLADGGEAIVDWTWRNDGGWYVDIESYEGAPMADAGLTDEAIEEITVACANDFSLAAYQNDQARGDWD